MQTYPQFPDRRQLCLDGLWRGTWLGDCSLEEIQPEEHADEQHLAVPGVFDTDPAQSGRRGVMLYRRSLCLWSGAGDWLRLHIGGLGLRARLWWNGEAIALHDLPYSDWELTLPSLGRAEHELCIAIDNRFNAATVPLFAAGSDFFAYGGIYRSVTLSELPEQAVERAHIRCVDFDRALVQVQIKTRGVPDGSCQLQLAWDGGAAQDMVVVVAGGRAVVDLSVPQPRRWSPDDPQLHLLTVRLGVDQIVERFGLRRIEARDGHLWLNGELLRLRGVNRHEAHPQLGPVQCPQLLRDDLLAIKALGCNFIRAVHYPHDQAALDYCDEMGLLVWSESLAWGFDAATMGQPLLMDQVRRQSEDMVCRGSNHPSIIIWGFFNECASDAQEAPERYGSLIRRMKALDPDRLISYASNRADRDRCFALADVMAVNCYPGWMWPQAVWPQRAEDMIRPSLEAVKEIVAAQALDAKPLLVSEIGACALYGCRDRDAAQWSEEFQAAYLAEACRIILADARFCGLAIWQFCDTRSYVGYGDVRCKPRGFNCAGLLDEYRRPKLAWEAVRAAFRTGPVDAPSTD